jgi:prevent-host-death family protein
MNWDLSEAKNRIDDLLDRACTDGPQRINHRGRSVVVLDETEYNRLLGKKPGFIELLMSGPGLEGVDLSRDKSPMRDDRNSKS